MRLADFRLRIVPTLGRERVQREVRQAAHQVDGSGSTEDGDVHSEDRRVNYVVVLNKTFTLLRWSYGILLYEIYAAGSLPLPHVQPYEQLGVLERGERPEQPDPCPDNV